MRIRTNIFVWVFFATVVPLTALTLGATYYSQARYQNEADREVLTSLNNIAASLERELFAGRRFLQGIARAPVVQDFLPVLAGQLDLELPPDTGIQRRRLTHYFEGFQTILPDAFVLRLLDAQGNTVIKVSHNHTSAPVFEGLSGLRYAEQEIYVPDFVQQLRQLPAEDVSYLVLPQSRNERADVPAYVIQDAVVPLYAGRRLLGAISYSTAGYELDRLLDHATRVFAGRLLIVEYNTDEPQRHGLRLYDETTGLHFAGPRNGPSRRPEPQAGPLLEQADSQTEGVYHFRPNPQADPRSAQPLYYTSFSPYPNQFSAWLVGSRVSADVIAAPFEQIRLGIWLFAAAAVVIALLLTDLGARRIAAPLCRLAGRFKAFADGERQTRARTDQPIDEVRALARAFNYLADTLQAAEDERDRAQHMVLQSNKLASIGQMAAGIGHEINNPLNNILSYAKLIQRNLDPLLPALDAGPRRQLQSDLQALRAETLRASEIVRGILNFARQVPPRYRRFAVDEWLNDTLALVEQAARSRRVELDLQNNYHGELEGDRGQLQQALVNLLLNAIQASPAGSTVRIDCRAEQGALRIEVNDTGPGIRREELDNIFDPFFTTKAEGEGSGLGLSISLGIIERHQGTLDIDNRPSGGVQARLQIPIRGTAGTTATPASEPAMTHD